MFKIEITEIKEVTKPSVGSVLTAKRPYNDDETKSSGQYAIECAEKGNPYTKEIYEKFSTEKTEEVKIKIFEQTVEVLNIKTVIAAINSQ